MRCTLAGREHDGPLGAGGGAGGLVVPLPLPPVLEQLVDAAIERQTLSLSYAFCAAREPRCLAPRAAIGAGVGRPARDRRLRVEVAAAYEVDPLVAVAPLPLTDERGAVEADRRPPGRANPVVLACAAALAVGADRYLAAHVAGLGGQSPGDANGDLDVKVRRQPGDDGLGVAGGAFPPAAARCARGASALGGSTA